MMICKADFEELFPAQFKSDKDAAKKEARQANTQYGYDMPGLARIGAMAATTPAAVAYGAAWSLLTGYGDMARSLYASPHARNHSRGN